MSNIKIADDELSELASSYAAIGENLNNYIEEYVNALENICKNSIQGGLVYENLSQFTDEAGLLKIVVQELTNDAKSKINNFVSQIDDDDSYIY